MCDTLEVVALAVRKVIHRVCLPLLAGAVVCCLYDAVYDRVAEVHVGACHVYLGTQHHLTLLNLASVHLLEQFKALFDWTVTVGAVCAGLCGCTLLLGNLLCALLVDIRLALLDEFDGKIPQLVKVVRSIVYVCPVETKPLYILHNRINILHILFCWVGVVEAQVAYAVVLLCHTEVHAYCLCMADVKVSVWFGRETGLYLASVLAFLKVVHYNLLDKTDAFLFAFFSFVYFCHFLSCFYMFVIVELLS